MDKMSEPMNPGVSSPNGLTDRQEQQLLGVGIKLLELQKYLLNEFPNDPRIEWTWYRLEEARMWLASRLTLCEEEPTLEEMERVDDDVIAAGSPDTVNRVGL